MVTEKTPSGDGAGQAKSSSSLRDLVIGAGVEILERDGLQLRPDSISYAKVFAYLEQGYAVRVTRGSVHERIWDSHEDFRRDVLMQTLQHLPLDAESRIELATVSAISKTVEDCLEHEQPSEFFSYTIGQLLWRSTVESETFAAIQSLKAIASRFNDPLTAEVLNDELDRRDEAILSTRPGIVALAVSKLGRRPRPSLGHSGFEAGRLVYLLNDAVHIGGHLNHRAGCPDPSLLTNYRPTDWDSQERWPLASVAFQAFFDLLTEQAPSGDVPSAEGFSGLPQSSPSPSQVTIEPPEKARRRRSRDELRRLVLAAGQELLLRDGLALQPEALRYSAVLAHVKQRHGVVVNRASIHGRIWPTHNDFCLDVLAHSVDDVSISPMEREADADAREAPVAMLDPDRNRYAVALDRLRRWMLIQVEMLSNAPSYRQRLMIKAALVDKTESLGMDRLREVIQRTDAERLRFNRELFSSTMLGLGFTVRPAIGLTVEEAIEAISVIVQAVVTGSVFNRLSGIDTGVRRFSLLRADGSGEADEWNLSGVAAWACLELLFVPDPERS